MAGRAGGLHCADCAGPITNKEAPCAKCGSLARVTLIVPEPGVARAIGEAQLAVGEYPGRLLDVCQDLIERKEFGIAVVVAHMACEMAVEAVLSRALTCPNVAHLGDAIRTEGFRGYNLANNRNLKWYKAITGDTTVTAQPFWSAFKESAKRRNNIVHGGATSDKVQAETSHAGACALIDHLSQVAVDRGYGGHSPG